MQVEAAPLGAIIEQATDVGELAATDSPVPGAAGSAPIEIQVPSQEGEEAPQPITTRSGRVMARSKAASAAIAQARKGPGGGSRRR
ncbi:hypothetical protein FS749_006279 [Ceratobasidium sp. UAMH 11750]|nr:hypothetical protein FS749_006279 [Ceratobasidium sp. UAMH 11750]